MHWENWHGKMIFPFLFCGLLGVGGRALDFDRLTMHWNPEQVTWTPFVNTRKKAVMCVSDRKRISQRFVAHCTLPVPQRGSTCAMLCSGLRIEARRTFGFRQDGFVFRRSTKFESSSCKEPVVFRELKLSQKGGQNEA